MWYFMRHGETFSNSNKITQGKSESLLTLKGIDQSKSIGYRLIETGEDFSKYKFICSSMVRTRHTISIVLETLGLNPFIVELDPLLESRSKGKFEGIPKAELKKLYPEEMIKKEADKWNYAPPGGESKEDMYQKIVKFIDKHKSDENLVITLHESGVRIMMYLLLNKTKEEIMADKAKQSQNYFYSWDGKEIKIM